MRARRGERIDPELPIVRLRSPGVPVLRAVVDEQQHARGRQALHERVHQRLRLRVDPVQVLEGHHERLVLAFAQEQSLHAVEDLLATLRRIEALPLRIIGGDVEEPQDGRAGTARGLDRVTGAGR